MNDANQVGAEWKRIYQAALLETDPHVAAKLLEEAEQAIVDRALALHRETAGTGSDELKSLAYSANFLAELRRAELNPAKNRITP